jgi:hypothetical protein
VEERRKAIEAAERERREALLKKNQVRHKFTKLITAVSFLRILNLASTSLLVVVKVTKLTTSVMLLRVVNVWAIKYRL